MVDWRRWKIRLLLVSGSLVFTVLLVEVALRIVGVSHPYFYSLDERIGPVLRPGAEGWFTSEGRAYVRINSDGMRDREHTIEKPSGCLRIAVLGDSYCEAMQVDVDQAFWAVMEDELQKDQANPIIEVLNFGISGHGTAEALLVLRHRVWKYEPDIVVLAFLTGNDLTDNTQALKKADSVAYFVHDDDGNLVLDDGYLESEKFRRFDAWGGWDRWLLDVSRLGQLANRVRSQRNARAAMELRMANAPEDPGLQELGMHPLVYCPPPDADWAEAWKVTEDVIALMHREVEQHNAKFVLAVLSNASQVHPDLKVREQVATSLKVEDLFYPDRRLQELGERCGFPVILLAPELGKIALERQTYFHGFDNTKLGTGHWNVDGHAMAGKLIADELQPVVTDLSPAL